MHVTPMHTEVKRLRAENKKLRKVADAARRIPTETPAPGGCSTVHTFQIEAGAVWELGLALAELDRK